VRAVWLTTAVLHESVFRTVDLPVGDRFDAWTERMGRTHAPMQPAGDRAADYRAWSITVCTAASKFGSPGNCEVTWPFVRA
jgi:hypothetical protein